MVCVNILESESLGSSNLDKPVQPVFTSALEDKFQASAEASLSVQLVYLQPPIMHLTSSKGHLVPWQMALDSLGGRVLDNGFDQSQA